MQSTEGRNTHTLRNMVTALERVRSGRGATHEEVAEMQSVLEAWQAQATSAQQELVLVSEKLKVVAEQRGQEKRATKLQRELEDLRSQQTSIASAERTKIKELTGKVAALQLSEAQLRDGCSAAESKGQST